MNIEILPEASSVKEFKLHTAYILQLLRDPDFYVQCPAYFFMRDQGLECAERFDRACISQGLNRASNQDDTAPAVESFVRVTVAMFKQKPELLIPLGDYIRGRLGYQVDTLTLYYKQDGKTRSIRF